MSINVKCLFSLEGFYFIEILYIINNAVCVRSENYNQLFVFEINTELEGIVAVSGRGLFIKLCLEKERCSVWAGLVLGSWRLVWVCPSKLP